MTSSWFNGRKQEHADKLASDAPQNDKSNLVSQLKVRRSDILLLQMCECLRNAVKQMCVSNVKNKHHIAHTWFLCKLFDFYNFPCLGIGTWYILNFHKQTHFCSTFHPQFEHSTCDMSSLDYSLHKIIGALSKTTSRPTDFQRDYSVPDKATLPFTIVSIFWQCLNIGWLHKTLDDVMASRRCPFLTRVDRGASLSLRHPHCCCDEEGATTEKSYVRNCQRTVLTFLLNANNVIGTRESLVRERRENSSALHENFLRMFVLIYQIH